MSSAVIDFLLKLKVIDRRGLTARDILGLYIVIHNPGINGLDFARALNIENRSAVSSNIQRLITNGFIEDRRRRLRKAEPNILHVLPAGLDFWNELKT